LLVRALLALGWQGGVPPLQCPVNQAAGVWAGSGFGGLRVLLGNLTRVLELTVGGEAEQN